MDSDGKKEYLAPYMGVKDCSMEELDFSAEEMDDDSEEDFSSDDLSSDETDTPKELRNWAELEPDLLSFIFQKVGCIEVLLRAQGVCRSWLRVSHEPQLWRRIDLRLPWQDFDVSDGFEGYQLVARNAIDRSCGQCVQFSVEYFATDDLFQYLIEKANALRCLHLVSCYQVSDEKLIEVAKKFSQLEELEISYCSFSNETLENVGRFCPQLKYLRLNCRGNKMGVGCDEEAFAIASNMPQLRSLQLFGNYLTDSGLRAILDGCPHLESLDLRQCFGLRFADDLKKRLMDNIRDLRLPDDSTADYGFDATIAHSYASHDEDYPSGFSEIDFLSDDGYYEFSDGDDHSDFGF